jgi:hypothetical protein
MRDALREIDAQVGTQPIERVLVARRDPAMVLGAMPGATWRLVQVPTEQTLGALFLAGLMNTTAPVVAITTDRFLPAANWLTRVLSAHADNDATAPVVVAGAIDVDPNAPLLTRAVYGAEYARFASTAASNPASIAEAAPAANLSMSRAAVDTLARHAGGCWDAEWKRIFSDAGIAVRRDPTRVVRLTHRFTFGGFAAERFHFSRALSGAQAVTWTPVRRVVRALLLLGLPAVLAGRLVVSTMRLASAPVARALPLMMAFTIPWTLGDIAGVVFGVGASARKVG